MSGDPLQVLKAQFAEFASSKLSKDDWILINRELGIHDKAPDRLYDSYHWGDSDMKTNTLWFLDELQDDVGEDIMLKVMRRAYSKKGGASGEMLEEYPALTALENGDSEVSVDVPAMSFHSKEFVSVENVPGTFYPEIIDDINSTYRYGVYDATLVLSRKLVENLLIEILRKQYGTEKIELYYDTNTKMFEKFSTLVENFDDNMDDFEHYYGSIDPDLVSLIDDFRNTANRSAHTIEVSISESDMDEYSDKLNKIAPVLFRISNQIQ